MSDDQLRTDVAEIRKDVNEIKVTLAVNTENIQHHIKRTDALQEMVSEFKTHITIVNTAVSVLLWVGGVIVALDQLGILRKLF